MAPPKPQVIVRSESPKSLKFELHYANLEVANALRRVILAEVPTIAPKYDQYNLENPLLNDVFIKKNTTVLHDQIMGHRISMLPIHMGRDAITSHERDDFKFVLNVTNEGSVPMNVTTKDIVVFDRDGSPLNDMQRDLLFPPDAVTLDHPIIARLKPNGDTFNCEFYGRRGVARDNARWCAASTCAFQNVVDDSLALRDLEQKIAAMKNGEETDIREQHHSIDRHRCFKVDPMGDPAEIAFHIESECGMTSAEIVISAFDVIIGKLVDFPNKIKIDKSHPEDPSFFMVTLSDEDHSMGNMYQAMCYRLFPDIEYIGYYMPHPLERNIVLKIKLGKDSGEKELEEFLVRSRQDIEDHVRNIRNLFAEATGIA